MALFKRSAKNYASIVAPLKKMTDDLDGYVGEQKTKISQLQQDKLEIEDNIAKSEGEIVKSESTAAKIKELIGAD